MADPKPLLMKQAVAVIDKVTTVICLDIAGQIRPLGEPFETLLGEQQEPPFHIHCRTMVIPWMPGFVNEQRRDANAELLNRPLKQRRKGPNGEGPSLPPKAGPPTPAPQPGLPPLPTGPKQALKVLGEEVRYMQLDDGVAFPWQLSDDAVARATEIWAPTFEGQKTIASILRNRAKGLDDFDGVTIPPRLLRMHHLEDYDGNVFYGDSDMVADLRSAADVLAEGLSSGVESVPELWRGMRVDDPTNLFRVGESVEVDLASFSDKKRFADKYADMVSVKYDRRAEHEPVMMRLVDGQGYRLKVSGPEIGWTGDQGEVLVRGRLRVVGHSRDDAGRLVVDVAAE